MLPWSSVARSAGSFLGATPTEQTTAESTPVAGQRSSASAHSGAGSWFIPEVTFDAAGLARILATLELVSKGQQRLEVKLDDISAKLDDGPYVIGEHSNPPEELPMSRSSMHDLFRASQMAPGPDGVWSSKMSDARTLSPRREGLKDAVKDVFKEETDDPSLRMSRSSKLVTTATEVPTESVKSLTHILKSSTVGTGTMMDEDCREHAENLEEAYMLPPNWPASLGLRENFQKAMRKAEASHRSKTKLYTGNTLRLSIDSVKAHSETESPRWMLDPGCHFLAVWNLLSMVVLIYDLTAIPYALAWDLSYTQGWLHAVALGTVTFWSADIMITFRTGYYNKAELVLDARKVAVHYIKGWFLIDCTIVCCDWLGLLLTNVVTGGSFKLLRLAKVGRSLRIAALLRMYRLVQLMEKAIKTDEYRLTMKIITIIVHILWFNHVMSCAWFAVGVYGPSDTGERWVDFMQDNEVGALYEYFCAFHWTVAQFTLGSMDIVCTNSVERAFNVVFLLLGLIISSTIISSLSAAAIDFQIARVETVKKVKQVAQFFKENHIDRRVAQQVHQQVRERLWKKETLLFSDVEAFQILSTSVRRDLQFETCKQYLEPHGLFRLWSRLDANVASEICYSASKYKVIMRMDDLFMPNVIAEGAYYLVHGTLKYMQSPQSAPVTEETVTKVSEGTWMSEAALWCHWIHVGVAEASTPCQVLMLNGDAIVKALEQGLAARQVTVEYCKLYYRNMVSARPPKSPWPNDVKVPFTEYAMLVWCMDPQVQELIGLDAIDQVYGIKRKKSLRKKLDALMDEVRKGTSTVVINGTGDLERLVSVVTLHLQDGLDRILVQVARKDDRDLKVGAQLPGMKQERGDLPEDSMQRLFQEKLSRLDGETTFTGMVQEVEVKESPRYGVHTKYLRTVCHAKLTGKFDCEPINSVKNAAPPVPLRSQATRNSIDTTGSMEWLEVEVPKAKTLKRSQSYLSFGMRESKVLGELVTSTYSGNNALASIPVYALEGSLGKVGYFAWVSQSEFNVLKKMPDSAIKAFIQNNTMNTPRHSGRSSREGGSPRQQSQLPPSPAQRSPRVSTGEVTAT